MKDELMAKLVDLATSVAGKIVLALLVFIIGSLIIKGLCKLLNKGKGFKNADPTVQGYIKSAIKIVLYLVLVISIIAILGVPMASVVTVLASCGVAVGLALQGALSNLAGGIMLVIFKPFKKGDYIEAGGSEGIVQEISMFYTTLLSWDNKKITIPNGTLMNSNVVDHSTEDKRRVDLDFACAKSEAPANVQQIMVDVMNANEKVLKDPAPFARLIGGTNEAMKFTVRAWCNTEDYWDVYFDLTQAITEALGAAGVAAPAVRVTTEAIK